MMMINLLKGRKSVSAVFVGAISASKISTLQFHPVYDLQEKVTF